MTNPTQTTTSCATVTGVVDPRGAAGFDRGGLPVPALTAAQAVSQVAWRALGPLRGRARSVLDWAGLAACPAGSTTDVAARHGISASTLRDRIRRVTQVGRDVPLRSAVELELTGSSTRGQDHLARRRQAALLGLTTPGPPEQPPVPRITPAHRITAGTVRRMLATLGPQPTDVLLAGVLRSRRARAKGPKPDETILLQAISWSGCAHLADGLWVLHHRQPAPTRWAQLVTAAAASGRDVHTTAQMHALLTAAGYREVTGPALAHHPLIERTSRNQWRILAPNHPPADLPTSGT